MDYEDYEDYELNNTNIFFQNLTLQWWSMRKYILKHTQMTNTFDTKMILHNYILY